MNRDSILHATWAIPASIYGLGLLTHNAYLARYGIYDFSILQARYIYTGVATAFYMLLSICGVIIGINLEKIEDNITFRASLSHLARVAAVAIIASTLVLGSERLICGGEYPGLEPIPGRLVSITIAFLGITLLFVWHTASNSIKGLSEQSQVIACLPLWFLIWGLGRVNGIVSDIGIYFFILWLGIFSAQLGIVDAKEGIGYSPIKGTETIPFIRKLNLQWATIILVAAILSLIALYSFKIYPLISRGWGGGRVVSVTITLKDEKVSGFLIDDNPTWISILKGNNVVRYRAQDVQIIETLSERTFIRPKPRY